MTQQDFIVAFTNPSPEDKAGGDEAVIAKLEHRLRQLPSEQQFQVLFPIAVKSPYSGDFPVLDAACILEKLSPACPLSCEDAVRALLPEWDVSLEQVPFYLAAKFGTALVQAAVADLKSEVTDKDHNSRLDTVSYWVHVYDGTWPPNKS
jgi:hypothetical protein